MQVLVAGATGFVGQAVVREALAREHQVFALVRAEAESSFAIDPDAQGHLSTVPWGADSEVLKAGFGLEPGAWIINAAGLLRERPGRDAHQIHEGIARMMVEIAEGLEASRLVQVGPLASSANDAFSQSKTAAERIIKACAVPWSVVRSAPVYGPGDDLLDEIGAWMARSPVIPKFLEKVPLQPIWAGDLAVALLSAHAGEQDVGGERILWGELLERCARAAGKTLIGPTLSDGTVRRLARSFGHRALFMGLVPFNEAGFLRHQAGYEVPTNTIAGLLGHAPRALSDYLRRDWPYRDESLELEDTEAGDAVR